MKNSHNTSDQQSSKGSFNKLFYTLWLATILSMSSCTFFKDDSSDAEKAASRLSSAETEYRKAYQELQNATKRFEDASKELEDARSDYDDKK